MFLLGFIVSLLGSLPLGALNITAFSIAVEKGQMEALSFALAVCLIELIVVVFMFIGMRKLSISNQTWSWLLPISLILLLYLSYSSGIKVLDQKDVPLPVLPEFRSSFLLGLVLSASNPLQFPYWAAWNKTLQARNWFGSSISIPWFYVFGVALGTFLALALFILLGESLVLDDSFWRDLINIGLALAYLVLAIYISWMVIKKRRSGN